ncbi:MAG: HAD-IIIA family hydrolase [Candidatus Goldbacteria bacterium]|nr:HAD-IIIA family hydrolase [Candidatus Goldiibacteriota bacterium]
MKVLLKNKLKKIKYIFLDVDGVLTDGKIIVGSNDTEYKNFDVKDGVGIYIAQNMGINFAILSGRYSKVIELRARELKIDIVYQDLKKKIDAYEEIKNKFAIKDEEICFIGDDLIDIPVMKKCGFSVAPKDACDEIKQIADYVCKKKGGEGCVREFIDILLKAKGLWQKSISWYINRENKNI